MDASRPAAATFPKKGRERFQWKPKSVRRRWCSCSRNGWFQRPYVSNEENQWDPLWNDVVRVADRVLTRPGDKHHPHFLGAVVLQQVQKPTGQMQERTIIDGQQRLTTLQLLMDALHAELLAVGAQQPAMRLEPPVANAEPFCSKPMDRFKV